MNVGSSFNERMKRDYIEFQEHSAAKGYLITFRCYGTWLHGDERGSVDRRHYNRIGMPQMPPDPERVQRRRTQLKQDPYILGPVERRIVESAVKQVAGTRGYRLLALNVRSNHAHIVSNNAAKPEQMMNGFKAYSTRSLRAAGLIANDFKPWSRHGSTKYLWTDEQIASAIDYVLYSQGDDLPTFT